MGAEKSNSATFFSITNGKICRQIQSPSEDSVTRTNKNNKVVHEEFFDKLRGVITDITTKEHDEYGKFWLVEMKDDEGAFILQMKYSSGYSGAFLKTLPNVDLSKEVLLIPKMTVEGDKKKTTLFINQNGHALKYYFNKENPNGIPELKQLKVKGKITWDDSDIMEFLENMVNTTIIPKLKGSTGTSAAKPQASATPVAVNGEMPF